MMNKNVKDLLEYMVNSGPYHINTIEICDRAKMLLHQDFIDEVKETFSCWMKYDDGIEYLTENEYISKTEFVRDVCKYHDEYEEYLNNHWNDVDEIIKILRTYSKELKNKEE